MVRAFASHQCVLGSIPGPGVICGLILLLVLFLAPRGFSPSSPIFHSPQKPTFFKYQIDLDYYQVLYHKPLARVIAQHSLCLTLNLHLATGCTLGLCSLRNQFNQAFNFSMDFLLCDQGIGNNSFVKNAVLPHDKYFPRRK